MKLRFRVGLLGCLAGPWWWLGQEQGEGDIGKSLGFRVQAGLGFRVQGLGFRV